MQESEGTQIWSLGQEDLLEEEMPTHSSILAGVLRTQKPGSLQSLRLQRVGHSWAHMHTELKNQWITLQRSSWKRSKWLPLWDGLRGGCEWTAVLFSGIVFHQVHICTSLIFWSFYFILEYSRLTMWWFQVHSRETQSNICMHPFSRKRPSHPACT